MTLPIFTLTAREVAQAALKAHAEGRLGYQRGHTDCLYRYADGSVCAVGAALPDEYVPEEQEGVAYDGIPRVVIPAEDNIPMKRMQAEHDALCSQYADKDAEAEFLALLRRHAGDAE